MKLRSLLIARAPLIARTPVAALFADVCYRVEYGTGYSSSVQIEPITGFPSSHSMVTSNYCGNTFEAGDPFPVGISNCTNCKYPSMASQTTFDRFRL